MDTMSPLAAEPGSSETTDQAEHVDSERIADEPASGGQDGTNKNTSAKAVDPSAEIVANRMAEGARLRLAMALVDGLSTTSADKAAQHEHVRQQLARAAGQSVPPSDAAALRSRIKSLGRSADRNVAEQLELLVRFEEQKLYEREGCCSMPVWMDVYLKIRRIAAFERLRVGRALRELPMLSTLFALGEISYSQLRVVTRFATAATDAEFAIAVLELSVSETKEYCERFQHDSDATDDAELDDREAADAQAALRAHDRRSLCIRDIDAHSTRITLDLPNDLAAEFLRSLEQLEDWIREGGEDDEGGDREEPGLPEQAHKPTATQRRADAAVLMSRRSLAHAGEAVAMADRYRVHVNVGIEHLGNGQLGDGHVGDELVSPPLDVNAPEQRPYLQGHGPISRATARRLAEAAGYTLLATDADGVVIGTATRAPLFTRKQRRILQGRDRRCQVPGCGATRHLDAHHVVHRDNGGHSGLDNAALVCGACHRLLHEGGFRLEPVGPNGPVASPLALALPVDQASRRRARAKVACVQRFRLFGPTGKEYGSLGAAKESRADRMALRVPASRVPASRVPASRVSA